MFSAAKSLKMTPASKAHRTLVIGEPELFLEIDIDFCVSIKIFVMNKNISATLPYDGAL
jgi:hypothetical protein